MVGLLFFSVFRYECRGTGYWMSRHPCLRLQSKIFNALECRGIGSSMLRHWVFWLPQIFFITFRMPQHWVLNATALAFLTCFHFSAFIPMPRHWTMNAAAPMVLPKFKIQVLIWMPRHWVFNAVALMSRPKWMPWHPCLNAAALNPFLVCLDFQLLNPISSHILAQTNLQITRWRQIMKNRKIWT